jgi:cyclic-di-GMP-binding protein
MSKESSFDVVSDFDAQEMVNAVDQTRREIASRFDLKDSGSQIDLDSSSNEIILTTTDDTRLRNILDILESKMSKRGLNIRILDPQNVEHALGGNVRQRVRLKRGIDKDLAKKIVSFIKDTKIKVQPSIQGDQIRVVGKNKDDLQDIIQQLRQQADVWATPLQFVNYR